MFKKNVLLPILSILIVAGLVAGGIYVYQKNITDKSKKDSDKSTLAQDTPADPNKVLVYTSFYPLYDFVKNVGGDFVEVRSIVPAGVEPHDYEPSSQQIQQINKSRLFVFNGADLDPWAKKIQPDLEKQNIQTLEMAKSFNLEKATEGEDTEFDPHIWLNPPFVKKQIELIKDKLIEIDPKNTGIFNFNYSNYFKKLDDLDADFRPKLKDCKQNKVVTSHDAFGYLGKQYNLEFISISGISPDKEPSSQEIAEIIKTVKENNIKVVFTETLVSPKLAETIANETGAKNQTLDPLEGLSEEDIKAGKDYISVMKENLNNIAQSLECK